MIDWRSEGRTGKSDFIGSPVYGSPICKRNLTIFCHLNILVIRLKYFKRFQPCQNKPNQLFAHINHSWGVRLSGIIQSDWLGGSWGKKPRTRNSPDLMFGMASQVSKQLSSKYPILRSFLPRYEQKWIFCKSQSLKVFKWYNNVTSCKKIRRN